jgi:sporulation protein YlmC with PRC-barrel domain
MRRFIIVATVLALASFLFLPGAFAQAQTGTTPGTSREPSLDRPSETTPSMPPGEKATPKSSTMLGTSKELYTSDLIGATVKNPQGESLGSIHELVLDPQDAKIKNAVIAMGGVLGIGAKTVAIPWQEVTPQPDGKSVVVAMQKEELENAPEWKKPAAEEPRPSGREPTTSPTAPRQGAVER